MSDPRVEQLLSNFVTEGREERVRLAEDHAATTRTLFTIQNQISLMDQKNDNGFAAVGASIKGLDSRITKLETNVEDTGRHNIEDLRQQLHEAKARYSWWHRNRIATITGLCMLIFGAVVTGCVDLVVRHLSH